MAQDQRVTGAAAGCADAGPLDDVERGQFNFTRWFGTIGSLLIACSSLGAGAAPVFNPVPDLPVIGLFSRLPSVALACAFTGMGMVVLAWLWLGRFTRPSRPRLATTGQLNRTMLLWTIPLVAIPPMFSRDVYSYLAQSKIFDLGKNPYALGPAQALGTADLLTRNVPNVWRDTPAPYGPGFLTVGRMISEVAGNHVITGALLHRLLELCGVALFFWALPRLARRFGVQPVSALWLGALNPLVLFHLVAGAHNEALMLGFMLAGFEVALSRMPPIPLPGEPVPPVSRPEVLYFLFGAALISLGAAVKFTALMGLGFLGLYAARRLGASLRRLAGVTAVCVVVAAIVLAGFSLIGGLGFGWIAAGATTSGLIKNWLTPLTDVGNVVGQFGIALGLGNHTASAIDLLRSIGTLISVLIVIKALWSTFKGRVRPMVGLGLALAGVVVFAPTIQPWYLMWAALPLAAGVGDSKFRIWATVISAGVALVTGPTGSGFDGRSYQISEAVALAVALILVLLFLIRKRIPLLGELTLPHRKPSVDGVSVGSR